MQKWRQAHTEDIAVKRTGFTEDVKEYWGSRRCPTVVRERGLYQEVLTQGRGEAEAMPPEDIDT